MTSDSRETQLTLTIRNWLRLRFDVVVLVLPVLCLILGMCRDCSCAVWQSDENIAHDGRMMQIQQDPVFDSSSSKPSSLTATWRDLLTCAPYHFAALGDGVMHNSFHDGQMKPSLSGGDC